MTWSPDDVALLGSLIDAGKSAGEVSKIMGLSRCAVIGRAFRAGWRFGQPRAEQVARPPPAPRNLRPVCDPADAPVSCTTYLDRETYDEVMALARKGNTSRNKIIGELVEWGLEAVRQGREGAT
jgi:hypothetical protein